MIVALVENAMCNSDALREYLKRTSALTDEQRQVRRQKHSNGYRGRLRGDPDGPERFYWTERFGCKR